MSEEPQSEEKIIIRLWPKTPVLYPMALLALICGIVSQIFGVPSELLESTEANRSAEVRSVEDTAIESESSPVEPDGSDLQPGVIPSVDESKDNQPTVEDPVRPLAIENKINKSQSGMVNTIVALIFLFMLAFSLFVVCIDFEVRWSLIILVVFLLIIMGLLMADILGYITLPSAIAILDNFTLYATPLFYYCVFATWVLLMIVSASIARLHYVKIESNEVVAVGGLLETQKRMSTFRMHYTKEIQDVFEYYLPFVRSGRLIFTFPNEEQPLIMDNVININGVLKKLDKTSSSFQVKESS